MSTPLDPLDEAMLDGVTLAPQAVALRRALRLYGALLAASLFLPVLRVGEAYIFLPTRFGNATGLSLVGLFWPGVVGITFLSLSFLDWLSLRLRAGVAAALLLTLPFLGAPPLAAFEAVVPPVSGSLVAARFGLVDGTFFPHESLLHGTLLLSGLGLLGIAGEYRTGLSSSRLGRLGVGLACLVLAAYYVVPYGPVTTIDALGLETAQSSVPASRNISLYKGFYGFAEEQVANAELLAVQVREALSDGENDLQVRAMTEQALKEARSVGQVKVSSIYFLSIYFVPALLVLVAIPALWPSRWRGDRTVFARIAGAGAVWYLLGFLVPMVLKDAGGAPGRGVWVGLRDVGLLVGFLAGIVSFGGRFLLETLEPGKTDDALPDDPHAWVQ